MVVRVAWAREAATTVWSAVTSPRSIPEPFAIVVESVSSTVPWEFEPHHHPLHELVWVRGGTMTVHLAEQVVTVPEGQGLWTPAGMVHSGRTTAGAEMVTALFEPERSPLGFDTAEVIEVTPVVAALLTHLERADLSESARSRAEAVVFDVLEPARRSFVLRVPRERRIGPIVDALVADPMNDRTLQGWAAEVGVSERTLARSFRLHTGLSFLQWRQSLRVHSALELLGEGMAVHEAAEVLGYQQVSTFIAAFKRVLGVTPGAFADRV